MAAYQVLSYRWTNPFFPPVQSIFAHIKILLNQTWLRSNLTPTLTTLLTGFFSGVSFGVCAGIGLVYIPKISRTLIGFIAFGRSVPTIAKISALFAVFGISRISQIASVFLSVFFSMVIATFDAYRKSRNNYKDFVALYSIGEFFSLSKIYLRASLANIFTASKFSFQVALIATLISEMYSGGFGIGAFIIKSQNSFDPTGIWAGIFIVGLYSLFFNLVFTLVGKYMFKWARSEATF